MAYGKAGRAPGSFDAVRTWQNVGIAGSPAFIPRNVGNATLGPEVTAELEAGFDAAWLDDRVNAGFTYYRQLTQDALLNVQQSPSTGFTQNQLMNVGEILNQGIEASVTVSPIRRENLGVDLGVNFSTNSSEVLSHVLPSRVGKPVEYYETFVVQNPEEIAAPRFLTAATFIGPELPTRIINGNATVRLPYGITLAARGEFKGGYYGTVEPVDIGRNPRSPACFPYYANPTGVALKPETNALWRARCTPSIARGWNFKQDNFRFTSLSGTFPLDRFMPERIQSTTLVLALGNFWTKFSEIPHYDTAELDSYRIPSPITLRASLRTTF
jgi:TonB-dependent starch-binding outer membrane protein SusC